MKFLFKAKDGGADSTVTGYWLVENKAWFSIVLLKFEGESREAYHSHAFNCVNWLLKGSLIEQIWKGGVNWYWPSFKPFWIYRQVCHKVSSNGTSWVLSFRGPWTKEWFEFSNGEGYGLTSGRQKSRSISLSNKPKEIKFPDYPIFPTKDAVFC